MYESITAIVRINKDYHDYLNKQDYATMGLAISAFKHWVRYDCISDIYMKGIAFENRKQNHHKCFEEVLGPGWESQCSDLFHKYPTKGLLWRLICVATNLCKINN